MQKHGEARGSLTKGQVMKCIKEMMPSKTSEQLRELEKAMDEQFPGYTLVEYKKLFDEDTNCDQVLSYKMNLSLDAHPS